MKRKFKREGTYVYLWLIHVDVWQKPKQYCKAIILQLKINNNNKKKTVPTIQFSSTVFTKVYSPDRFPPNSLVLIPQLQGRDEFLSCDEMFKPFGGKKGMEAAPR